MGKSSIKGSGVPGVFLQRVYSTYTHKKSTLPRNPEHATERTELCRSVSVKGRGLLVPGYTIHPGTTPELFFGNPPTKGKHSRKVNVIFLNVPGKNEFFSPLFLGIMVYTGLIRDFSRSVWLMCSGFKPYFFQLLKNLNGGFYGVHC